MTFSHFVELITVNKPTDEFSWKLAIFSVIQDFTGFASTIITEFEITFFMRF